MAQRNDRTPPLRTRESTTLRLRCRLGLHRWNWRILWGAGAGTNMDARCQDCPARHNRVWIRTTCRNRRQRQATRLNPIDAKAGPPPSAPATSGNAR